MDVRKKGRQVRKKSQHKMEVRFVEANGFSVAFSYPLPPCKIN